MNKETIALLALLSGLSGCSSPGTDKIAGIPYTNASTWTFMYSSGNSPELTQSASGGITFRFPSGSRDNNVKYLVTRARNPLTSANNIVANITVEKEQPSTEFRYDTNPNNTGDYPANMRLYIQRLGDDLSGIGNMQYYRWWATNNWKLDNAQVNLQTALSDPSMWTSVYGVKADSSPEALAAFNDAKRECEGIGFTFGGGFFAGHGVYCANGTARFTLNDFKVT